MRNVLSANFLRLKHSRILWLCLAYMLYDGLRLFYSASQAAAGTGARMAPSFQFFWLGGIVFAVYCSFFISGEYGEGGVRRKMAAGAPRPAVYLANLTSCTLASLLMCGDISLQTGRWSILFWAVPACWSTHKLQARLPCCCWSALWLRCPTTPSLPWLA